MKEPKANTEGAPSEPQTATAAATTENTPTAPATATEPKQPGTAVATNGAQPKAEPTQTAQTAVDARAVAQEAVKAERERVCMIKAVCNGEFPEIEAQAVAEGWDRHQVTEAVLKAFRAKQPTADITITVKKGAEMTAKHIEAALSLRAGIDMRRRNAPAFRREGRVATA